MDALDGIGIVSVIRHKSSLAFLESKKERERERDAILLYIDRYVNLILNFFYVQ